MSRLYGKKEDISSDKVKDFFNKRASKDSEGFYSIVLFQDEKNSEQRHEEEKKIFYENIDVQGKKVLEIGCGIGRWVEALHDKCDSYLGLDFSEELLGLAKKTYSYDNCKFQIMPATNIKVDELLIQPPFDVFIFSGFLLYINDDDLDIIIDEVNQIGAEDKKVFVMEPTSCMETRLTLKDFYSEGLESDYSAIYRTEDEYLGFFKKLNGKEMRTGHIFDDLSHHSETNYMFYIIE